MSTLGERLRELRGPSSQAEMAASVGVKQQNWARWEGDVVTPSLDMIVKIIRANPCPTDWLLGLKDSKPSVQVVQRGSGNVSQIGNGNTAADCSNCASKQLADLMNKLGITVADLASIAAKKSAAKLPRKK